MKNFTWIIAIAMAAIFSFTAASCSDDDDNNYSSENLIGEWYVTNEKGYYYWNGERENYNDSYSRTDTWLYWTFNSDGTGIASNVEDSDDPLQALFTWSISGSKLNIKVGDEIEPFTIKKLTSTTLITHEKGTDEDGPYESTLTFSKSN